MRIKTFDCVETQHRGGERIREKTKGLTAPEQMAFWKEHTAALRRRQRAGREA